MLVCMPFTISGSQIGLGLAILGALWEVAHGGGFSRTPLDEPILCLLGVTFLSALVAHDPAQALRGLLGGWIISTLYLTAGWLREPRRLERYLGFLVPPAVLFGIYGIVQHLTGVNLFGKGIHTYAAGGRIVYLPRGGFSHYQTFANVFFLLFCVVLALLAASRDPAQRVRRALASVLLAAVLIASYTRGIWIALLAGVGIFVLAYAGRAAVAAAACMAAALALLLLAPSPLRTRALSVADTGTNVERLLLWETSWSMLRDHPLLGVGVGNFRRAQDDYVRDAVPMAMTRTHAHNIWLQIAVERGILGAMAFLWLAVALFRTAFAAVRRHRHHGGLPYALATGGLAGITGFFIDGFVQNNFGDTQVAMVFWLVAGIVVVSGSMETPAAGAARARA